MLGLLVAKQSSPTPVWQTIVVILAAVAFLAAFVYAANRFGQK